MKVESPAVPTEHGEAVAILSELLGTPPAPPAEPAAAPPAPAAGQPPAPPAPAAGQPPLPPAPGQPPAPPAAAAAPAFDFGQLAARFDAAPPAPALPPEPPPEPPPGPDGKVTPSQAHAYATLRAENTRFRKEVLPGLENRAQAAEAKAKEAEAKAAALLAEKEKAEREASELTEKVGRLSLSESPAFKARYGAAELTIQQKLETALVQYGRFSEAQAKERASALLASASDPAGLVKATEDLHPAIAGAAMLAAQDYAALLQARDNEIREWRQSAAASGIEEAKAAVVRNAEDRRKLAASAIDSVRSRGSLAFVIDPADPEGPAKAEQLETAFHGFMQNASEETLASAAAEGFVAPLLHQAIQHQADVINQLQDQLRGYAHAAGFPVSPFSAPPPSAPPPPPPANVVPASADDPVEVAKAALWDLAKKMPGLTGQ